ncbi:MAG: NAD-glutamate dehydrogenase [Acidobacteriota bacterium]
MQTMTAPHQELFEDVRARVRERLADAWHELGEPFVERYLNGVALEEPARLVASDVAASIWSLLDLAQQRAPGQTLVRAFTLDGDDWARGHSVVEIVNDDMPFLVDSVTRELTRRNLVIHTVIHPQATAQRDGDGRLIAFVPRDAGDDVATHESYMHLEINRQPAAELEAIRDALDSVLADVRRAVSDWPRMRQRVFRIVEQLEVEPPAGVNSEVVDETKAFLRWAEDHHFTFLGYREYDLARSEADELQATPVAGSGLGLLRDDAPGVADVATPLAPLASRYLDDPQMLMITKSSRRATVHRVVPMDLISVKRFDSHGNVVGERRFLGLFTSRAYSINAGSIPIVRRKVRRVIERSRFLPASHDSKALRAILENYSRDELFQISVDDLFRFTLQMLNLALRPRLALLVRRDDSDRFVSCMVFVPRDRHTTQNRLRIQRVLERAFAGEVSAFYTSVSDSPLATLQFIIRTETDVPAYDVEAIEKELFNTIRSWSDGFEAAWHEMYGSSGPLDPRRYRDAFPVAYREAMSVEAAIADALEVESVVNTGLVGLRLYQEDSEGEHRFHLKTFETGVPATLSTYLPMLENMGLTVLSEVPFEVRPRGADGSVWLRDFTLESQAEIDLEDVRERFQDAFYRIWIGEVENDGFNRLVLLAGLDWRQAVVLRAYSKFLRQAGITFSQRYIEEILARHPVITLQLVELFGLRLDPTRHDMAAADELEAGIRRWLETVTRLDEDRVLRRFLALIRATLRTNYFQMDAEGSPKPYTSLKLDSGSLRFLPEPRPAVEIFVYSPDVEGVHLRGGKVARGGIRWSDRREDFRTEVLGLVKAQMVKNAVIVPVGAKGGFVVKRPPAERAAFLAEGERCYRILIRGLLDVTDNLDGSRIVPPRDVVRLDDDDPYLVVAADKGTATFSDIANEIAGEYGFWLGDAFASGGSAGYDHKKMAITARGAWESVKEHFRSLGKNIQREDFVAVGVGDMGGDVFGNGMLLSEHIMLVGAFNHLHVFVDPHPDPATSFAERQRLFESRGGWDAYDRGAMSPGGDVFDRQAKAITVSPEVQERFGLASADTTPNDLIRAMLQARVDLLWFGGIGTYVRGSDETDASVGDRANDELRITASELHCLVIGEGANLGLTQRARIEFALRSGRINTDFIDNSGGVDCSDHEVNIKIALAQVADQLDIAARNELLEAMTDEVAELVLRDNYLQAQAITLTLANAKTLFDEHVLLIRDLERAGQLNRRLEQLPDEEALLERRDSGLSRPEIAVLLAHAKIHVYNELIASDLPDEPELVEDLVRYFPTPMQERYRGALESHRLRREIVATHVTNSMVNRVGPSFVIRIARDTGRAVSDIARAYTAARDAFGLRAVWEDIERLDNQIDAQVQIELVQESIDMIDRATRWFLRYGGEPVDVALCVETYRDGIAILADKLEDLLPSAARPLLRRRYRRYEKAAVPLALACRVAGLGQLPAGLDIVRCALALGEQVEPIGRIYFAVGERFRFARLRRAAWRLAFANAWQKAAVEAAVEDLFQYQAELTRRIVEMGRTETTERIGTLIDTWIDIHPGAVARIDRLLEEVDGPVKVDLAMVSVATRELRRLVES